LSKQRACDPCGGLAIAADDSQHPKAIRPATRSMTTDFRILISRLRVDNRCGRLTYETSVGSIYARANEQHLNDSFLKPRVELPTIVLDDNFPRIPRSDESHSMPSPKWPNTA
jgi:hypothetical protein